MVEKKSKGMPWYGVILIFALFPIMFVVSIPYLILQIFFDIDITKLWDKSSDDNVDDDLYKSSLESRDVKTFIRDFNTINRSNYRTDIKNKELYINLAKCLSKYIQSENVDLPSDAVTITESSGCHLANYRRRDHMEQKGSYKLDTCPIYDFVDSVNQQNMEKFYLSLFSIPPYSLNVDEKIGMAKYIKRTHNVAVSIITSYLDTREMAQNRFILENGILKKSARDCGCMDDYE